MDAAEFNELFDIELAAGLVSVGAEQIGRSVFWRSANLSVAILRTESRYIPPPQYTLLVRHRAMRNMEEKVPAGGSKRPSDYPLKLRPSDAKSLLGSAFRYEPQNLGRFEKETFDYATSSKRQLRKRMKRLRRELSDVLSRIDQHWTPDRFVWHLTNEGEDAWCERMWIEDLKSLTK